MSSQHSQEVQLLLTAEKRASEKVSEARKRKARRLKQAKEEAACQKNRSRDHRKTRDHVEENRINEECYP